MYHISKFRVLLKKQDYGRYVIKWYVFFVKPFKIGYGWECLIGLKNYGAWVEGLKVLFNSEDRKALREQAERSVRHVLKRNKEFITPKGIQKWFEYLERKELEAMIKRSKISKLSKKKNG